MVVYLTMMKTQPRDAAWAAAALAGQGDNTLGRIHCEVGDIGGGDGASDVLSHDGVSFSFV